MINPENTPPPIPEDWNKTPSDDIREARETSEKLHRLTKGLDTAGKLEFIRRFAMQYPDSASDTTIEGFMTVKNESHKRSDKEIDGMFNFCISQVMDIEDRKAGSRYSYEEPLKKLMKDVPKIGRGIKETSNSDTTEPVSGE